MRKDQWIRRVAVLLATLVALAAGAGGAAAERAGAGRARTARTAAAGGGNVAEHGPLRDGLRRGVAPRLLRRRRAWT